MGLPYFSIVAFKGFTTCPAIQNILRGDPYCSCSTFTNLGTTDPMADSTWIKQPILALHPHKKFILDSEKLTGGIIAHKGVQKKMFTLECTPFQFPDDKVYLDLLMNQLAFPYVYLYKGNYIYSNLGFYMYNEPTPADIHPNSCAMLVAANGEPELDKEYGYNTLTLKIESVY